MQVAAKGFKEEAGNCKEAAITGMLSSILK
jgi:hypothetical protein